MAAHQAAASRSSYLELELAEGRVHDPRGSGRQNRKKAPATLKVGTHLK
jgi:hypothetical protein